VAEGAGGTPVRRILAANPGPFTGPGTTTFIIGRGEVAVIDPGPDLPAHRDAILAALGPGERVTHILVTHAHADHSGLAPRLRAATGAAVLAFGDALSGRSAVMVRLAAAGLSGGGEGLDAAFRPDRAIGEGCVVEGPGWRLTAHHLPGHAAGHLGFALGDVLFVGDAAMGWSTSLVSPPDGDMAAYMATLARLAGGGWRRLLPAHGAAIDDPAGRLAELTAHRLAREAAILSALGPRPKRLAEIAAQAYAGTPEALMPAARRNAFAHLVALWEAGRVEAQPDIGIDAAFRLP
jgi:hydroxyacylglutathione hydrolase